jgi:hypothetical protein
MMTTTTVHSESVLAIDVDDDVTRAILFDVAGGLYRFISAGTSLTSLFTPSADIGIGVRLAIENLQNLTGRTLLGPDDNLIIPSQDDGSGVDKLTITVSAGAPLRVVAVGQLEGASLASACRLATSTYSEIVEKISLNDQRKQEARIDAIIRARPNVIVIAGGTEGGAWQSVLNLLEIVGLACYLYPGERPEVLYAGNQALLEESISLLDPHVSFHHAPNVRPTLEEENVGPAQDQMADLFRTISLRRISGLQELDQWAGEQLVPTATGFGRVISFLSKVYNGSKGVLGIDVGGSTATSAVAYRGDMTLNVYPWLKMTNGIRELMTDKGMWEIMRWLPMEFSEENARNYLYNKSIYPNCVAVTDEEMAIELALTRQIIQNVVKAAMPGMPAGLKGANDGQLPWFEPILASGKMLSRLPSNAHIFLVLLDAIQPSGVTTVVVDQNNLTASLGASAAINPLMVVQVIESSAFVNMGTVISPIVNARPGTPILRIQMTHESGEEVSLEIKQGDLQILPLSRGKSARLNLQPLHLADIGMGGPGRAGSIRVIGGNMGVVVDARGRPLKLPEDGGRRRDLLKKWLWHLGIE